MCTHTHTHTLLLCLQCMFQIFIFLECYRFIIIYKISRSAARTQWLIRCQQHLFYENSLRWQPTLCHYSVHSTHNGKTPCVCHLSKNTNIQTWSGRCVVQQTGLAADFQLEILPLVVDSLWKNAYQMSSLHRLQWPPPLEAWQIEKKNM